ncbi:hypothetical protein EDD18DRAFT_1391899 [Armillaria luteobubalina]|uniref:Uncharacterized protein n=1 Tax=Armillaria luteobubalina TaxID=153913 RepID=A0AA39Q5V3_9AGAR|nr:hypothetical protein EDD18DRAFT_1391899 [Armillaria luteobubalina]
MADLKIYFKPRPISPTHGHSNYLPFHSRSYCQYGPFFTDYETIPCDATEVYTIHSRALSAALSTLFNDFIPSLSVEVPDPSKFDRSAWPDLLELAWAKVSFSLGLRIPCEDHAVLLFLGDRAPVPPPRELRGPRWSPEWYELVVSIRGRGDVALQDESLNTELELFVWVYIQHTIDKWASIWRYFYVEMLKLTDPVAPARLPSCYTESSSLFDLLSNKALAAASALASVFTVEASNSRPSLLSPSSSNGSSVTDSTSYSHDDDLDDEDVKSSGLLRRRNLVVANL